jgi:hypothetical protein
MQKKQWSLVLTFLVGCLLTNNIASAQAGLQYAIISNSTGNIVGQLAGNGLSLDNSVPLDVNLNLSSFLVWQPISGIYANDIGANTKGSVWIISNTAESGGYAIYRLSGNVWTKIPGSAVRIAVDTSGNAWVVNNTGNVFHYNGSSWDNKPGNVKDIAVGANGAVWCIGADGIIYKWDGSNWSSTPGGAARITVDRQGNAWVVNANNEIYRYNGSSYVRVAGAAVDIAAGGDGSIWIAGTDGKVSQYMPGDYWSAFGNGGAISITMAAVGTPLTVNADKQIYKPVYVSGSDPSLNDYLAGKIQFATTIATTATVISTVISNTQLTLVNGGNYVASFSVSYSVNGTPTSYSSGSVNAGWRNSITIPSNATNVYVVAYSYTGDTWEKPWKLIFSQTYATASTQCIQVANTALNPTWSTGCN